VDEVLAVGDVAFQKKCLGKMEDVATKGRTVLFVSHNMSAVQNMCERCLVLREGTVMFNGNTVKAIERYINSTSDKKYGFADLSHHPGRLPHMKPIIQSVALCTDEGSERHRSNVKTGEEVMFEISYDCGDITLNYAMIGICTPLGERVCSVGTHLDPEFIDTLRGRGVLKCHIPELTLVDGEYSLLVAMGTRTGGNIDCVSNALRFRVELGDYFLTGATLLPGQGYLAQKAHWHIISRSKEVG